MRKSAPAAVLVFIVAVSALALAACGGGSTQAGQPSESGQASQSGGPSQSAEPSPSGQSSAEVAAIKTMLNGFYAAANTGNATGAKEFATAGSVATLDSQPELVVKYEQADYTVAIDEPAIKGDGATVTVKLTQDGAYTTKDQLVLAKEDGVWKVDIDRSIFAQ
jgi:hypothetical protein